MATPPRQQRPARSRGHMQTVYLHDSDRARLYEVEYRIKRAADASRSRSLRKSG